MLKNEKKKSSSSNIKVNEVAPIFDLKLRREWKTRAKGSEATNGGKNWIVTSDRDVVNAFILYNM